MNLSANSRSSASVPGASSSAVLKRLADGETLKSLPKSYGVTHRTSSAPLRKFEAPISTP